jgi:hypothetical protein
MSVEKRGNKLLFGSIMRNPGIWGQDQVLVVQRLLKDSEGRRNNQTRKVLAISYVHISAGHGSKSAAHLHHIHIATRREGRAKLSSMSSSRGVDAGKATIERPALLHDELSQGRLSPSACTRGNTVFTYCRWIGTVVEPKTEFGGAITHRNFTLRHSEIGRFGAILELLSSQPHLYIRYEYVFKG